MPASHAAPVQLINPADARLLGRVKLVVEQGKILGEQFLLADFDITVGRYDAGTGRCPDIDLTAQDPAYVHRQHARLTFSADGRSLTLHDMGGRNGCYVNNQLLDKNGSAPVRLGDKVRIGRVVMRMQPATDAEKDPRK
jgi:pSer/pThr/pTyr-binding forkhead associated (FHA) protein